MQIWLDTVKIMTLVSCMYGVAYIESCRRAVYVSARSSVKHSLLVLSELETSVSNISTV